MKLLDKIISFGKINNFMFFFAVTLEPKCLEADQRLKRLRF